MRRKPLLAACVLLLFAAGCGKQASAATPKPQATASSQTAKPKPIPGTSPTQLKSLARQTEKKLPGVKFPHFTPFSDEETLQVKASGNVSDYLLSFTTTEQKAALAPLILQKHTPTSTAAANQADAALAYQPLVGTAVGLANDITGYLQQQADLSTLTWHQGHYAITVKTADGVDYAKVLAQNIDNFIHNNTLPLAQRGAIVIDTTAAGRGNTVKWRELSAYYTISGVNPMQTLRLAFGVGEKA
ncbi:hypothetical protein [Lacticaseibacillus suibinensis]|uniref:hypothetical protein n=1 Tax=Lacticaseibacillus suibinensis TaxID=2486011 RepID=UPI0019454297|nr:hypothetical protein [Lacticaseibacillus suibinensis]